MGFSSLSQYYIYYFLQSQTCFLRGIIHEWIDLCVKSLSRTWRPSLWVMDSHRVNLAPSETLVHFIMVLHIENRDMWPLRQKWVLCFLQLYMFKMSDVNLQDSKSKVYLMRCWTAMKVQYALIHWKLLQSKCSTIWVWLSTITKRNPCSVNCTHKLASSDAFKWKTDWKLARTKF